MGDTVARRRVTTIVQFQGPAANLSERIITKELVPLKHELISAGLVADGRRLAEALHTIQRSTDEATQSARSLPVLGGSYWPAQSFAMNTPQIFAHGVQGGEVAWLAVRVRPMFAVWTASTAYSLGAIIAAKTANGYFFVCTTAGTTAGSEPAWVTTTGATTTSNTAVFTCQGIIAPTLYETAQDVANGRVTLWPNAPLIADLWFFPQSKAQPL